jgi:predicted transcriptional regulator
MGGKGSGPTRDVNAALRAREAMDLRKLGATYQQIADKCGYADRGAAHHAVQRELGRTIQDSADDLRIIENERLDDLYRAMVARAIKGDEKSTWYVDRCLAIMERRARLWGLDAPTRAEQPVAAPIIREYPQGVAEAV